MPPVTRPAAEGRSTRPASAWTHAALTLTVVLWSSNFIVGRALRDDVAPATLNFLRWAIALGVLMPITWPSLRQHRALLARHWMWLAALGCTGIAAFQTLGYVALTMTTALNAVLLLALAPLAIAALSWLLHRERLSPRQCAGLGVSLAGAAVLILHGSWATLATLRFNGGDLCMLAAVALWAVYSVLLRRRPAALPPLTVHTASVLAGTLAMLPWFAWQVALGRGWPSSGTSWAAIGFVAVFSSALAHSLWVRGVATLGANRAGAFIHLMPLAGAILAMVFLGEQPAPHHLVGALLVVAGVVLTNRR